MSCGTTSSRYFSRSLAIVSASLSRSFIARAIAPGPPVLDAQAAHQFVAILPLVDRRARNRLATLLAEALVFTVGVLSNTHTRRLIRLRIDQHHLRDVQRRF